MTIPVKHKSKIIAAIVTLLVHVMLFTVLTVSFDEESSSALSEQDEAMLLQLEDFVAEDIQIRPPGKDPLTDKSEKASESLDTKSKGVLKPVSATAEVLREQPREMDREMVQEMDSILNKKKDIVQSLKVDTVKPVVEMDSAMAEVIKMASAMIDKDLHKKTSTMSPHERVVFYTRNYKAILAFKKVYPYALKTRDIMENLNRRLAAMTDDGDKKALIKETEKMLFANYELAVRTMTRSQGELLLKLIARETNKTGYEIIRQYKGAFAASFWYGVGKIFGTNLKTEYHRAKEDSMIEVILQKYKNNDLY